MRLTSKQYKMMTDIALNPEMLIKNTIKHRKVDNKPIHKFNNGRGATLCHECGVIITEGLTKDLYCEKCEPAIKPAKKFRI